MNILKKKNYHNLVKLRLVEVHLKNLREKKAWEFIKDAGSNEFKEGDAVISKKHCNFFVNNGKATSSDIEKLINKVKNCE